MAAGLVTSLAGFTLEGGDGVLKNDKRMNLAIGAAEFVPGPIKWPTVLEANATVLGESGKAYVLISPFHADQYANRCWTASCETLQKRVSIMFFSPIATFAEVEMCLANARVLIRQPTLRSPNIVSVYDACQAPIAANCFVVLEDNLPTRPLSAVLQNNSYSTFLTEKHVRMLFGDIVTAVSVLHSAGCVHRRLRETSFVVSEEGVVKLLDHGCSSVPPEDEDPRLNLFRPPEFTTGVAAEPASGDVWSLGVLLVIMATGVAPLAQTLDSLHPIECPTPEFWAQAESSLGRQYSLELKDLVSRLLVPESAGRCSLTDVLTSPWVNSADTCSRAELAAIIKSNMDAPRGETAAFSAAPFWEPDQFRVDGDVTDAADVGDLPLLPQHEQQLQGGFPTGGPYAAHGQQGFPSTNGNHHGRGHHHGHFGGRPNMRGGAGGFMYGPQQHHPSHNHSGHGQYGPASHHGHPHGPSHHPYFQQEMYMPRPPVPAICKFALKGGLCTIPQCQFYHPPGSRAPASANIVTPPRPRPGPGYVCHNCGDTTLTHFKADCPHPQRCRYTTHGGVCTRWVCPFFHPQGSHVPQPYPVVMAMHTSRPHPGPGYVCHNCGDTTMSHFKADCPHPQRCRYTTHGTVCSRPQCNFFHPPGTHSA